MEEDSDRQSSMCTCGTAHVLGPIVRNPHLNALEEDVLYHIGLSSSQNLRSMFGDVKFVCVGGTAGRMEKFAHFIMKEIDYKLPAGTVLEDISGYADRFSMYKVGPVLCASHGMGCPSISILLHELIKLTHHARCNPIFIRIGTCGGIGIDGGTVVISEEVLDSNLRPEFEFKILGKSVIRPTKLDESLVIELITMSDFFKNFRTVVGKTLCTHDFYEGQGRLDGAICDYTEEEKFVWLKELRDKGVINIEMESAMFAALTQAAGIRSAVICVAILNRLNGDQVDTPSEVMYEWQDRPQYVVAALIREYLGMKNDKKRIN